MGVTDWCFRLPTFSTGQSPYLDYVFKIQIHPSSFMGSGDASWDHHDDDKPQKKHPAKQPEPVGGDWEHEIAKLHLLQGVKMAYI